MAATTSHPRSSDLHMISEHQFLRIRVQVDLLVHPIGNRIYVGGGQRIRAWLARVRTSRREALLGNRGPNCCMPADSRCERWSGAVALTCQTTPRATPGAPRNPAPGDCGLEHRCSRSHHTSQQPTPRRCQPYLARHMGWLRLDRSPQRPYALHSLCNWHLAVWCVLPPRIKSPIGAPRSLFPFCFGG